jgi:ATP-dependent DNA ligase
MPIAYIALDREGIVSKRLGYPYRSSRVNHWLKIKNPAAPVVKHEADEDWDTLCGAVGKMLGSRRSPPL